MLLALTLGLGWRRRKLPGLRLVLKTGGLVGAIAKWLAGGVAAAAKSDRFASAKPVRLALHINELDYAFDAQGAVIADRDFCRRHLYSQLNEDTRFLNLPG
jgi:hypothetical protein